MYENSRFLKNRFTFCGVNTNFGQQWAPLAYYHLTPIVSKGKQCIWYFFCPVINLNCEDYGLVMAIFDCFVILHIFFSYSYFNNIDSLQTIIFHEADAYFTVTVPAMNLNDVDYDWAGIIVACFVGLHGNLVSYLDHWLVLGGIITWLNTVYQVCNSYLIENLPYHEHQPNPL